MREPAGRAKPALMTKQPLLIRLYYQPCLTELARFVSYGGRRDKDVKGKCDELRSRFGDQQVTLAVRELTVKDEKSGLTVLRPNVRKLCWQLLGPQPEHPEYESYWAHKRREPPAEHQPPGPEEDAKPAPKRRGRGR